MNKSNKSRKSNKPEETGIFKNVEKKVFLLGGVLFFVGAIVNLIFDLSYIAVPVCYFGLACCLLVSSSYKPKKKKIKKSALGTTLTIAFFLATLATIAGTIMEINEIEFGKWIVYFCLIPFSCYIIWYSIVVLDVIEDFKTTNKTNKK